MKNETIAKRIAYEAHSNQYRKNGRTPYINHVEDVVSRLKCATDDIKAAAWLHDVLEDTNWTEEDLLLEGISDDVIDLVRILTKTDSDYMSYIERINNNYKAKVIKIADIFSNLSDSPSTKQAVKYGKALDILLPDYINFLNSQYWECSSDV